MSKEKQAEAYLKEAELTLKSTKAIFQTSSNTGDKLWAQVIKNGYDALEQAASAAIAQKDKEIPRRHPAKINKFIELQNLDNQLEKSLLKWLQRRSQAQYVDIKGGEVKIPHNLFDKEDAEKIIEDVKKVIDKVKTN